MLDINFDNFRQDRIGEEGLGEFDLDAIAKLIPAAHEKFQQWRTSGDAIFYDLAGSKDISPEIFEVAANTAENFENLVVLGIGGSALGLRCAAQALLPPFWNMLSGEERKGKPRLFVCDNIDPDTFSALMRFIDVKKTCFTVISKSGKTIETASQFFIVLEKLKQKLGDDWRKNLIFITDPTAGELRPMVKAHGITSFAIPPKLGGRFSVLSPVGLFPAACCGIDINALIGGAKDMADRCAKPDIQENPAYAIGSFHYWFDAKKNKNISVMMPYSDALLLASDWYSQLWAESLGKSGRGQTPVKAQGATDQHSQVQLYMEGPNDKVFNFLRVEKFNFPSTETKIKNPSSAFSYLDGIDLGTILNAEQRATEGALTQAKRPSLTISFPKVDAHHLGEFFMLYEIATAIAGAHYGIDPFDQPGVELGKKLTKEILEARL